MTSIRRGWFHLASGAGIGRVLGFVSNLLLSRLLGPAELGLFNLVTTTVQTSDTLVRCGGDYALNFELGGRSNKATKTEHGVELVRGLAQLCSLVTLFICIVVFVWVWWGQGLFPRELVLTKRFILSALLLLMIACEGISASAWEVLLVSHRTVPLAYRQGVFSPLRLFFAGAGALFSGVSGAMAGWCLVAFVQCAWLKIVLRNLWKPLQIWPLMWSSVRQLLKRGLPFYTANLLASMIFYPLLLQVANGSGLSEIGYLRVGQVLQQLFAFLPATLVPVLFLRLRSESSLASQVIVMERPFRVIWLLLLEFILLYCLVDKTLTVWLFGPEFVSAVGPTRLLLVTALFECLSQLVIQPLLAAGKTRLYGFYQNAAAFLAAFFGWLWIPTGGLAAYLVVRLLYVVVPLIAFGAPLVQQLHEPRKMLPLALASIALLALSLTQVLSGVDSTWLASAFLIACLATLIINRQDLLFIRKTLRGMT